jgi:hypothetical protein
MFSVCKAKIFSLEHSRNSLEKNVMYSFRWTVLIYLPTPTSLYQPTSLPTFVRTTY